MINRVAYTTFWLVGLVALLGASWAADAQRWGLAVLAFGIFLVCCTAWLSEKIDDQRL